MTVSAAVAAAQRSDPPTAAAPQTEPISFGIVVDNSGSFRLSLDKVIRLTTAIIEAANGSDEAFLVTFVDTAKIRIRQEMTSDRGDLNDAAENMFVEGGPTAILDAVMFSAKYLTRSAKEGSPRAIVLITDGDDRENAAKIETVIKYLKDERIRLFAVGIADEKVFPKVLDRLTRETGGRKYVPRSKTDIEEAIKQLASALHTP